MARRRLYGLERVLGVNALASTAYGNVGSSIYYALGLVASFALGLTPVVFVIAGMIFLLTAATYAEGTAMHPEAGGSSSFARRAFNEFASFGAAWTQLLNYVITIAISAFFMPHYLGGVLWDELLHAPGDIIFGIVVIAILAVINVVGAKESTGVNIALAVIDFMTQLLLVALGAILVLSPETLIDNVQLGIAPTWTDFLIAIPIAMIAYTGIETISNLAEEARDERKTIPKAINRVVIAVFAIYFTLPVVALSALPVTCDDQNNCQTLLGVSGEEGYASNPILGIVKNLDLGPLQGAAEVYIGLLAATILFVAVNAGIIGVSRIVYSMGIHRQLPDRLRQLHPRFHTPWIGILVFAAVACLALIPGQAEFLANVYAFGAMLSFTIAHIAITRLRITQPDVERPYRGPGTLRFRGKDLPLFALIGGTGTFLAWVTVTLLHLDVAIAGVGWLIVGFVAYVAYRKRIGLDLTTTAKVAMPRHATEREAEYESIVVAFEGGRYRPDVVNTAIRLAARRKRGIHVVVTITVPRNTPINAGMPEEERAAQEIIEQARVQGGRRVTGHWEKVRPGQSGPRIVDVATRLRARAVVLPIEQGVGRSIGRTAETLLRERPCRIIIESAPSAKTKAKAAAIAR